MTEPEHQALSVKRGEVTFRQKLASQQSQDGRIIFPELRGYDEMIEVMKQRAITTHQAMANLQKKDNPLSPFLEIGAEKCQRSLVLTNELNADGIAMDISFDMLRLGSEVARGLGYDRLPLRICGDANNLPILDNVFSFTFCYETLHHFPDPGPVIGELVRVLRDQSVLYFDEEPVKGSIYRFTRLYQRHGHRLTRFEQMMNRLGLLPLISKAGGVEIDHGILENEFDLLTWQKALAIIPNIEVIVNKKLNLHLNNFQYSFSKVLAGLLGGNIEVYGRIEKSLPTPNSYTKLDECLKCPTCPQKQSAILHPFSEKPGLICENCGCFYPEVDGVLFLLEYSLGIELYPEIYRC